MNSYASSFNDFIRESHDKLSKAEWDTVRSAGFTAAFFGGIYAGSAVDSPWPLFISVISFAGADFLLKNYYRNIS